MFVLKSNHTSQFITSRCQPTEEYPDAHLFYTLDIARRVAISVANSQPHLAPITIYQHYGMSAEEIVAEINS